MTEIKSHKAFRRMLKIMILSLAATLTIAACTPTGSSDSSGTPDAEATFRYAFYGAPATLDPHTASGSIANVILFVTYDRLVHLSPDGDLIPGLAESWEFSDDAKTLTLQIREGVVFHDGTDLDAKTVKANLDRAMTVEGSAVASDLAQVDQVVVVDDYTIDIELKTQSVALPAVLSDRAGAMVCPSAFDDPDLVTTPCGTGMYKIDKPYIPGSSVSFVSAKDYWDPEAVGAAAFEFTFLSDSTARFNALRTGEVDAINIEADQIAEAEAAKMQVVKGEDLGFGFVVTNMNLAKPLQDERVRLAINLAIDRQAIVEGVLQGQGSPASQPFPKGYFAHNPDVAPFPYDVKRAKELMAEAGYADGFNMELSTIPTPIGERRTEAVAGMLKDIGITAKINVVEAAALGGALLREKTLEAAVIEFGGRNDPSITLDQLYSANGLFNPAGYGVPEFEALYPKSLTEQDPKKRAAILQQLSAMTVEHPMGTLVLYSPFHATAASTNVTGLKYWVTGKTEFRGVGVSKP